MSSLSVRERTCRSRPLGCGVIFIPARPSNGTGLQAVPTDNSGLAQIITCRGCSFRRLLTSNCRLQSHLLRRRKTRLLSLMWAAPGCPPPCHAPASTITVGPEGVAGFGRAMREIIPRWEIPFWKAYIQSVVDGIEIDVHTIRIVGDKTTLEQVDAGSAKGGPGVRSSCTSAVLSNPTDCDGCSNDLPVPCSSDPDG
jgi:hypothetical protein